MVEAKGRRFRWGKKVGKKWGKKKGAKRLRNKANRGPKFFAGSINVVEPKFDTVNDAYDNLLGLKLITTGTCNLFGDFTARFFFVCLHHSKERADPFDGTCAIEDAAGNILNAAFFNAAIQFPGEGETDLLIPIDACAHHWRQWGTLPMKDTEASSSLTGGSRQRKG